MLFIRGSTVIDSGTCTCIHICVTHIWRRWLISREEGEDGVVSGQLEVVHCVLSETVHIVRGKESSELEELV